MPFINLAHGCKKSFKMGRVRKNLTNCNFPLSTINNHVLVHEKNDWPLGVSTFKKISSDLAGWWKGVTMVGDPCSYLLGVWILYIGGTFNALRAFREGCGHTLKPLKGSNSTISTPTNFWFSPKMAHFSGILSYFLYLTVRDCYLLMFLSPISVLDTS